MRLLVVLSPTDKWETNAEYIKLRKFLQRDGYIRIAPEVYMRIVQNRKAFEKQYMVTGEADYQEKTVGVNYHIVI
jgi:CRISPR-associated protein Cas2